MSCSSHSGSSSSFATSNYYSPPTTYHVLLLITDCCLPLTMYICILLATQAHAYCILLATQASGTYAYKTAPPDMVAKAELWGTLAAEHGVSLAAVSLTACSTACSPTSGVSTYYSLFLLAHPLHVHCMLATHNLLRQVAIAFTSLPSCVTRVVLGMATPSQAFRK